METYIVTYYECYPGDYEIPEEDRTKTAFVLADSFDDAVKKTCNRFKKEFERVYVKAVCVDKKATIIV